MAKHRCPLANGRDRGTGPFVQLPWYLLDCPAYRSLPPIARCLLVELIRRYDGKNNGRIALGQREAAEAVGIVKRPTIAAAFRQLEERGFIQKAAEGAFSCKLKQATEWRLTWLEAGVRKPEKPFMKWRPEAP